MAIGQQKEIKVVISYRPVDQLDNQAIVLFLSESGVLLGESAGLVDLCLNGFISQLFKDDKIKGTYGESVLVASDGRIPAPKILLFGLGEALSLTFDRLEEAANAVLKIVTKIQVSNFAAILPVTEIFGSDYPRIVESFLNGIISGVMSMDYTPKTTLTLAGVDEREEEVLVGLNRIKSTYSNEVKFLIARGDPEQPLAQSN